VRGGECDWLIGFGGEMFHEAEPGLIFVFSRFDSGRKPSAPLER